jgi:small conductance mechanosensitive channel
MVILANSTVVNGWLANLLNEIGVSSTQAQKIQNLVYKPLYLILIVLIAAVINYVGTKSAKLFIKRVISKHTDDSKVQKDLANRIATLTLAVRHIIAIFIWTIATITALGVIGLDLTPILTGATVVGAALAFGAQNLVKDYLSGFLLLMENQISIGDVISVLDVTGTVTSVSFRSTVILDEEGVTWHIANGDIRKLGNKTRKLTHDF